MFKPKKPSQQEAQTVLSDLEETKRAMITAQRHDRVNVVKGPFKGFTGVVDKIDPERKIITVSTEVFGRVVPIPLSPTEIELVDKPQ